MQCPTCKAQMKPLFTSWFCPSDCDKPGSAQIREFVKDGRRWRGTLVKKIVGPNRSWWLKEDMENRNDSHCMKFFLEDPQGFADTFWADPPGDRRNDVESSDIKRWLIHIVEIKEAK